MIITNDSRFISTLTDINLTIDSAVVYITFAMPNQRAKNKTLIGAFVDSQLKLAVTKFARKKGISSSDVLNDALKQYLERNDPRSSGTSSTATATVEPKAVQSTPQQLDQDEAKEVWLL